MTRLEALKELVAKVEAGLDTAHDHARAFPSESAYGHCTWHDSHKASCESLDAAKALHEAALPKWDIQITTYEDDSFEASVAHPLHVKSYDGVSNFMSRAWLIAILKALISMEKTDDQST